MKVSNKYFSVAAVAVMAAVLIGATFGALLNLTVNHTPSPKLSIAATVTPKPTPTPKPTTTPTPTITPTSGFTISGSIFIDINGDGNNSLADSNYTPGATVSATQNGVVIESVVSKNTGKYSLINLLPGAYSIELIVPDKYRATTSDPVLETITAEDITGLQFGIIPDLWSIPTGERFVMCKDLHQFVKDHCN